MMKNRRHMVILGIFFVLLIWFGWHCYGQYQTRKQVEAQLAQNSDYAQIDTQVPVIEFEGKRYIRNSAVKAILCIGVDTAGTMDQKISTSAGQADSLLLVAYNVADDSVRILMIPRDTMTPITLTDLSGNVLGKDVQHINLSYAYGDGRELSCERTREAVSELLNGLRIESYLAVNTDTVSLLNDTVGGITVTIETEGMGQVDPAFQSGQTVTLMGQQAERFVRYRDIKQDHSAITRMVRQKQYMEAFFNQVQQKARKDDQIVVNLMNTLQNYMITNMSKDQYMKMGMAMAVSEQGMTTEDILCIPGQDITTEFFDEYHHDPEATQKMVLELFYREE